MVRRARASALTCVALPPRRRPERHGSGSCRDRGGRVVLDRRSTMLWCPASASSGAGQSVLPGIATIATLVSVVTIPIAIWLLT